MADLLGDGLGQVNLLAECMSSWFSVTTSPLFHIWLLWSTSSAIHFLESIVIEFVPPFITFSLQLHGGLLRLKSTEKSEKLRRRVVLLLLHSTTVMPSK